MRKFKGDLILFGTLVLCSIAFIAQAQYVAQTLQQRLQGDQNIITNCNQQIVAATADEQSIANDTTANAVLVNVPILNAPVVTPVQPGPPPTVNQPSGSPCQQNSNCASGVCTAQGTCQ